jgi:glutamine amidotransferase/cyclase
VFVPLTVGGGIRGFKDDKGQSYSALEVAAMYFRSVALDGDSCYVDEAMMCCQWLTEHDMHLHLYRSGADKVSIGSDAVEVAEEYLRTRQLTGTTSIEQISAVYGRQAVVVSIDPRRVYVSDPGQVGGL